MVAALVGESVVLLLLAVLVIGLLRSHASILRILHDAGLDADGGTPHAAEPRLLQIGSGDVGSDIGGYSIDGDAVAFGVVGVDHDTLLAFLSTTCHTCEPFWDSFASGVDVPGTARLIVVVQDGDNIERMRALAGPTLTVVLSDAAWQSYEVPGSPHFVYVEGSTGRIRGQGTAATWAQVFGLMQHALGAAGVGEAVSPRDRASSPDNAERIDAEQSAAGIGPGHPSLYPSTTLHESD